MTPTVQLPNICEFLTRHFVDVFETMLSMKAVCMAVGRMQFDERVTGTVGFAGENVNGAVYLHLSAASARRLAGRMLGMPPEEITNESEVNDVVGETANMLTGGLKSWLCDVGATCAVSTPAIIRGASFAIEPIPDVQRELLAFDCEGERVWVEIHIKVS